MNSSQLGSWFEDKTKVALKEIQANHPSMSYRFADSKAARNYLGKQPGDHLFLYDGISVLIEEKASEKYDTLRSGFSSLWPKSEAAYHRLWHRAKCPSWVIFCDKNAQTIEIWDGGIANYRVTGKKIPVGVKPILTDHLNNYVNAILSAAEYEQHKRSNK